MSPVEVLEGLLAERASCRGFLPDPVPRPTLERLLTMAQRTPSWCNTQPWHVHVTSGEATERLRGLLTADLEGSGQDVAFPEQYTGVRLERRREVGWQLYDAVGVAKGDRQASALEAFRNFELFGAPHVAVVTTAAELGTYGAVDVGLYVQSFLLAARSLGLATCAQAALASRSPLLHEHLGIPEDEHVVCGISLGLADPDHPANSFRATRAPISDAVTFHD